MLWHESGIAIVFKSPFYASSGHDNFTCPIA